MEQPPNPLDFIQKEEQKVMINPGVPYISTSQKEIFENRNLSDIAIMHKRNNFVAMPVDPEAVNDMYEGVQEETYITNMY